MGIYILKALVVITAENLNKKHLKLKPTKNYTSDRNIYIKSSINCYCRLQFSCAITFASVNCFSAAFCAPKTSFCDNGSGGCNGNVSDSKWLMCKWSCEWIFMRDNENKWTHAELCTKQL